MILQDISTGCPRICVKNL